MPIRAVLLNPQPVFHLTLLLQFDFFLLFLHRLFAHRAIISVRVFISAPTTQALLAGVRFFHLLRPRLRRLCHWLLWAALQNRWPWVSVPHRRHLCALRSDGSRSVLDSHPIVKAVITRCAVVLFFMAAPGFYANACAVLLNHPSSVHVTPPFRVPSGLPDTLCTALWLQPLGNGLWLSPIAQSGWLPGVLVRSPRVLHPPISPDQQRDQ